MDRFSEIDSSKLEVVQKRCPFGRFAYEAEMKLPFNGASLVFLPVRLPVLRTLSAMPRTPVHE